MKNKTIPTASKSAEKPNKDSANATRPVIKRKRTPFLQSEPRIHSAQGVRYVHFEWLAALLPICLWSIIRYGVYALAIELSAVVACMAASIAFKVVRSIIFDKKTVFCFDLSPAVTGLCIAFLLPVDSPVWLVLLAVILAAAMGALFGGISNTPISLPAFAVLVMRMIFPSLTDFPLIVDSENGKTMAELLAEGEQPNIGVTDLLLGRTDGMIGEIVVLLIVLAAFYLIYRKQIGWHIPVAWLLGGAVVAYLTAPGTISEYYYVAAQLFTGGFMLVGCLIVPHRTTAPITARAGLVIGALGGALTILFRNLLGVDGALLAALICSLPARPLDRLLAPLPFGGRKK